MTKNRIKVGFILNDLVVGGVSQVVIDLCNRLDQSKFDVYLLLLSDNKEMLKISPLIESVKVFTFKYDFVNDYSLKAYLYNSIFIEKTLNRAKIILNKIVDLKLEILHFHTLPRQLTIGILAKRRNPNIKLIFTDHLCRITKNDYNFYQRYLLALAYKRLYTKYNLIAISKAVKDYIVSNKLKSSKFNLYLLENSINIKNYERKNNLHDLKANCTIFVSRINHHKGQNILIKAWQKIDLPNKGTLLLVGPDESAGKILEQANGDNSIIFTGSVSNVKDYLNKATLAVFPSEKEGLPISLLEKMAFKLPLIVSNIPELTTILKDEVEGLHFRLNDIDDLKNKIQYAIKNKSRMIEIGKNARKKVELICRENNPIIFHEKVYQEV